MPKGVYEHKKRTDQEIVNKVCQLYQRKVSISQIARTINASRGAVRYYLKERGLYVSDINKTQTKFSKKEIEQIKTLVKKGWIVSDIARELNRSPGSVNNKIRKLRLIPNKADPSETFYLARESRGINQRYELAVNTYNKHKDWSFNQIAAFVYGLVTEESIINGEMVFPSKYQVSKVKQWIGRHLILLCRESEDCPFTALLPETEITKGEP